MTITSASAIKKLLLLFLVFSGLYFARDLLIPFALASLLAMLFLPLCQWFEKKIPRVLSAILCVLLLLLIFGAITAVLGWQVSELSGEAARIEQRTIELIERSKEFIYERFRISIKRQEEILNEQPSLFSGKMVMKVAGSLTSIGIDIIFMLVYVVLLLYYRNHIHRFFIRLFPEGQEEEGDKVLSRIATVSQEYLTGLAKMIGCLWIMYSIGFGIAGVKNPIFFAIICGLLEIIPFIGNITGTSITVLVSVARGAEPGLVFGILFTYGIVQFVQGWILEPLIVGHEVKINSLFTILALVTGDLIWGLPPCLK
jgi:predicted PurR-regulated permease PerM